VVLVGTGLSMADVVLKLTDDEHAMPRIHAISRHGLLPAAQSATHGALALPWLDGVASATTARRLLTSAREVAARLQAEGRDWRDLINGIRNIAPRLWQQLSEQERRRFLRHAQSYWDVCRHRLPGDVLEHIHSIRDAGKLNVAAGRIRSLHALGERIAVDWRPRGQNRTQTLLADAVVNACGPDYRLEHSRDPLMRQLHADGQIMADPSGVGLSTAAHGALVRRDGSSHHHLFYLGPLLRGAHWETTAAAELREHAIELADILARRSVRQHVAFA
jgi:uncharacterized NAD(P)/FAD-binding protein YdhS